MAQTWKVIERRNPLAVHAHCESLASARRWISELAPTYCQRGYFMDKSLTPQSFSILCPDGTTTE